MLVRHQMTVDLRPFASGREMDRPQGMWGKGRRDPDCRWTIVNIIFTICGNDNVGIADRIDRLDTQMVEVCVRGYDEAGLAISSVSC
jgi:hypothetical protein